MDDAVSFEDHLASLILQGFDGIRRGGPYDLPAYGQEGYQDSQQSWDQKHHRSQFSMVSIEIQVLHHGISRDRGSDQIGNKDPFDKIPGQQVKNYRIRSSQDFADSDFFGAPFRHERGQSEQTEAGHKQSQPCKSVYDPSYSLVSPVKLLQLFIQELEFKGVFRDEGIPGGSERSDRAGDIFGRDFYEQMIKVGFSHANYQWGDFVMEGAHVKIFDHADDLQAWTQNPLPDRVLHAGSPDRCLIDNDGIFFVR